MYYENKVNDMEGFAEAVVMLWPRKTRYIVFSSLALHKYVQISTHYTNDALQHSTLIVMVMVCLVDFLSHTTRR